MYACPFGVPTFEWSKQLSLIKKCNQCADLQAAGQLPACAAACPAGAIKYGTRNELLAIAKQRIDDPKANYVKHIYGENEVGGTSMLYLAALPFESLGFPTLPEEAFAETSQEIMHLTPIIAGTVETILTATYFVTKGREMAHAEAVTHKHPSGGK
jgi:formate dehydrogenase iron-sulfur subunit